MTPMRRQEAGGQYRKPRDVNRMPRLLATAYHFAFFWPHHRYEISAQLSAPGFPPKTAFSIFFPTAPASFGHYAAVDFSRETRDVSSIDLAAVISDAHRRPPSAMASRRYCRQAHARAPESRAPRVRRDASAKIPAARHDDARFAVRLARLSPQYQA